MCGERVRQRSGQSRRHIAYGKSRKLVHCSWHNVTASQWGIRRRMQEDAMLSSSSLLVSRCNHGETTECQQPHNQIVTTSQGAHGCRTVTEASSFYTQPEMLLLARSFLPGLRAAGPCWKVPLWKRTRRPEQPSRGLPCAGGCLCFQPGSTVKAGPMPMPPMPMRLLSAQLCRASRSDGSMG